MAARGVLGFVPSFDPAWELGISVVGGGGGGISSESLFLSSSTSFWTPGIRSSLPFSSYVS